MIKVPSLWKPFAVLGALALSMTFSQAQVLMLDFGPTVVTGASQSNSPYHTANVSFSGTTWNRVQTADIASGLLYADGTAATGISLNLGATTSPTTDSSTLLLAATPSGNNALGNSVNTGVYENTSVGRDGIFTGDSGQTRAVGLQLSGLAAGEYDIYVTARNTNTSVAYSQTVFVGTSDTSGDFVLNGEGMSFETLSYPSGATGATLAWVDDSNYVKFTITLETGDVLNLATLGDATQTRGFLNSLQIVAVPEPSVVALMALGVVATLLRRSGPTRRREPAL